jgi:hypothetical protein
MFILFFHMNPPGPVFDDIDSVEWELLSDALRSTACGIEPKDAKTRRIRTELGFLRIILSEEIRGWNGKRTIDPSLFIGTFKAIRRIEKECESLGIKKTEFLIFLELILSRFERQKLKAKKPFATISEFRKMKGVMENGSSPL